jgi:hypothetical protein
MKKHSNSLKKSEPDAKRAKLGEAPGFQWHLSCRGTKHGCLDTLKLHLEYWHGTAMKRLGAT